MMTWRFWLAAAFLAACAVSGNAEEIAVGNYGVSANGMPFGVALVKGYFKDEGLNITGLIS
jgi:NitT/TauT family transport system substrate-binding protein